MSAQPRVRTPDGLGKAGTALHRAALRQCKEWSFDELQVLELAARTADRLARIAQIIDRAGVTVIAGRAAKPHPLLAEERERQKLLAQLLKQLDVPPLDEDAATAPAGPPHLSVITDADAKRLRSEQARKAARARWDRAHHA